MPEASSDVALEIADQCIDLSGILVISVCRLIKHIIARHHIISNKGKQLLASEESFRRCNFLRHLLYLGNLKDLLSENAIYRQTAMTITISRLPVPIIAISAVFTFSRIAYVSFSTVSSI